MRIVEKPWGYEEVWIETDKYVSKILFIKKGHSLSLQHHEVKEETIRILSGQMALRVGTTVQEAMTMNPIIMNPPDDIYHIPPKTIHRMIALEDTRVLEVSTPELHDVVRHLDHYGRE